MPMRPAKYGQPHQRATDRSGLPRHRGGDRRPSASARGYDTAWQHTAAAYLLANPWCGHCLARDLHEPATEVDHVEPFQSKDDPRRLDWENLQGLCKRCHSRKTAKDRAKGLTRKGMHAMNANERNGTHDLPLVSLQAGEMQRNDADRSATSPGPVLSQPEDGRRGGGVCGQSG